MGNTTSTETNEHFGWKRDGFDHRDLVHDFQIRNSGTDIDLTENVDIEIYTQGHLGSCTSQAIAFCYEYDEYVQKEDTPFMPSRLFIYYNERDMEGTTGFDAGAMIRDGIKSINQVGVCSEDMWPYDISTFTDQPLDECYEAAKHHQTVQYKRVQQSLDQITECLHNGFPVVFGFTVFESFKSDEVRETGIVPLPEDGEGILGGHAVVLLGISHEKQMFKVRNSWTSDWGDHGYCWFPFEYILNQEWVSDLWTVQKVRDE